MRGELWGDDGVSVSGLAVPIFHRDFSTILSNGLGAPLASVQVDSMLRIKPGREHRVVFNLAGRAFVRVWLVQFDEKGVVLKQSKITEGPERIAEVVLNGSDVSKKISRRFFTLPEAEFVRFGIEHVGSSKVVVEKATLEHLD
jgi:hypothetical protein